MLLATTKKRKYQLPSADVQEQIRKQITQFTKLFTYEKEDLWQPKSIWIFQHFWSSILCRERFRIFNLIYSLNFILDRVLYLLSRGANFVKQKGQTSFKHRFDVKNHKVCLTNFYHLKDIGHLLHCWYPTRNSAKYELKT